MALTDRNLKNNLHAILRLPEGFPVIDATEPLELTVTEADGRLGVAGQPDSCAFSVACRRQNGQVIRSEFLKTKAYLIYADRCVRYKLSKGARDLVRQYDALKGFKAGAYKLLLIDSDDTLGVPRTRDQGRVHTGNGEHPETKPMGYIRGRKPKRPSGSKS